MSGSRAIWEVARRELVERSRSRALRISIVLVLVLAVGGADRRAAREGQGTPTDDVGLVGSRAAATAPALRLEARAAGRHIRLHRLGSVAAASAPCATAAWTSLWSTDRG